MEYEELRYWLENYVQNPVLGIEHQLKIQNKLKYLELMLPISDNDPKILRGIVEIGKELDYD